MERGGKVDVNVWTLGRSAAGAVSAYEGRLADHYPPAVLAGAAPEALYSDRLLCRPDEIASGKGREL